MRAFPAFSTVAGAPNHTPFGGYLNIGKESWMRKVGSFIQGFLRLEAVPAICGPLEFLFRSMQAFLLKLMH